MAKPGDMLPSPSNPAVVSNQVMQRSRPKFVVVGIPGNRRVSGFVEAVTGAGLPAPRIVGWREIVDRNYGFEAGEIVRIDSPGEDPVVDESFRGAGDSTRVEGSGQWYRHFSAAIREVTGRAEGAGARVLGDADEIAVMFDKRLCHRRLEAAGVCVPAALPISPRSYSELVQYAADAGMSRVFVKLAHGSSASGVIALQWGPREQVSAVSSVELGDDGVLHNSLRVRTYRDEWEIAAIVDRLAPDGLHVEQWLPKASLGGRTADVRVVVVGGVATHAVVRTSTTPLTNLHLGGSRGELHDAVTAAGENWSQLVELSEQAASCFPAAPHVGVDVLPGVRWRRFSVGEVNAFGDLLPGLTGLPGGPAEGLNTYQTQVASLLESENREYAR
ncbi:MAG: STM4014 family protein [Rhodococcus sp. (in: high G+C Gram-positive bacteria)]|uniref:STM4014 family protein n=1 Tax=Rhodococcus sp. TaxID=1831 RepID=UPI002AD6B579|nr:STM4014 family protein [Rhodococcus sp. (in: high G+C Gram-positive bacteria)]